MKRRTGLILGGTGITGRALAAHLSTLPDWDVVSVSRGGKGDLPNVRYVTADLSDPAACRSAFRQIPDVTHVFYTALANAPTFLQQCPPNAAMFKVALDAIVETADQLEHVCLVQGTKYYGQHLGPFKNPARESDPRHIPPNFYYDQQDALVRAAEAKPWSWSCVRPHLVCGFALGNPLNIISVLGVYATLSRELGLPLRFPGKPGAFASISQTTDAGLLARAMTWMATDPACANQAFNITNGDYFRYQNLWPRLAAHFGMEPGPVQTIDLPAFMADKAPLWDSIVSRHGLLPTRFQDVADWTFAAYTFGVDWDVMSSTTKSRQFGFVDAIDTEDMILRHMDELRARRIIP
ncbi:SDR family oxidoreductase [Roseixanthobacter pseudopolyaromaticivorans]|uniref:SDR family oxidoreductase n=1 Tax=Xanthobacteraceae TaxID=335928 RepID=UPI00372CC77B